MLPLRHDDKEKSAPVALLKSLAAMLCHTLEGFKAAVNDHIYPGQGNAASPYVVDA